jgi:hypothetical protein
MAAKFSRRELLHEQFARQCDPATDARLAASAIYWAHALDGPIKEAAARIRQLQVPYAVFLHMHLTERDEIQAYFAELRALTLARHARYWVFLIQMYQLREAVDEEIQAYFQEFVPPFDHHLAQMAIDKFQPTPAAEEGLRPWAEALSLHGRFWVRGRDGGVSVEDLMKVLWEASPIR